MIYIDWRPIAVEASRARIEQSGKFVLEREHHHERISALCRKHFFDQPYFPVFLYRNFERIEFTLRNDGLFLFSFRKNPSGDILYSDEELAQFVSYFLKAIFGHTHVFDDCPINISRRKRRDRLGYKVATNSPVQIAWNDGDRLCCRVQTKTGIRKVGIEANNNSLTELAKEAKIGKLMAIHWDIENKTYPPEHEELAVLKIKRQFSSMFDLTMSMVQKLSSSRRRISYLMVFVAIYCSLIFANTIGFSKSSDSFNYDNNFLLLPLTLFAAILILATALNLGLKTSGFKQKVQEYLIDFSEERVILEGFTRLKQKSQKFFKKFIFGPSPANYIILITGLTFFVIRFLDQFIVVLFPAIGLPVVEVPNQIWNLEAKYVFSASGIKFLSFTAIFLITLNYLPKLLRYRFPKFRHWKRCMGYLTIGSTYLRVVHKLIDNKDAPHSNGFYSAIRMSNFNLQNERIKLVSDWIMYLLLLTPSLYGIFSSV